MANEAVIIELLGNRGDPVRFTCDDAVGITKGALCVLLDPKTASGANVSTVGSAFAGIAAHDKVASDGATTIALYTNGIFDLATSSVVNVGDSVVVSGANFIKSATNMAQLSGGSVIGKSLETAAGAETIAVRVRV